MVFSLKTILNPNLARQRRTNNQHGPVWKINLYPQPRYPLHSHHFTDGSRLPLNQRNRLHRNTCHIFTLLAQRRRFVTVVGDSEFIIYTSLTWRNNSFGNGISFACVPDSNTYAVLFWRVYESFRERPGTGMKGSGSWSMESLHGRILLGAGGTGYWFCDGLGLGVLERLLDGLMFEAKNVGFLQCVSPCSV